jgi:hypothetical protein
MIDVRSIVVFGKTMGRFEVARGAYIDRREVE